MKILLIALFLILPLRAFAFCDDWRTQDTVLESALVITRTYDAWSSSRAVNSSHYRETDPVYGTPHPSEISFLEWWAASIVLHGAIACYLTGDARTWWQAGTLTVQIAVLGHNAKLGVGFNF